MQLDFFHFANPLWLWVGILIPFVGLVFFLYYQKIAQALNLEKYIDSHLLPYLMVNKGESKRKKRRTLLLWSLLWASLTLAVAGPRWNFREIETFSRDQSLVIALDLSESMNVTDLKPSRLTRAKQKIEDLLKHTSDVKIGLIAFAADSHMIAPITDDKETIRHLLSSLETSLVSVQGSKLTPALDMAANMLHAEPGTNKALLIISDGGFEDSSALSQAKKLANKGIILNSMGVGTVEGAPLKDHKRNGNSVMVKLEKDRLVEVSKIGGGRYLEVSSDEGLILNDLEKRATAQMEKGKKNQIWDERFYMLFLPCFPILLWWFRRGALFSLIFFFSSALPLAADVREDYFLNQEQQAESAFNTGDFKKAAELFQDPYRRGVALYKAGDFKAAEKSFAASKRAEVYASAKFNEGNSLVFQDKLKEAVTAYEDVLQEYPDHKKAKDNLDIVRQMMNEQKDKSQSDDKQNKDKDQNNEDSKEQDSKDNDSDKNSEKDKSESDKSNDPQDQSPQENKEEKNEEPQKPDNPSNEQPEPENNEPSKMPEEVAESDEKSELDQEADTWLNQIKNDPQQFLKNKFYLESKRSGAKGGIDPW